MRDAVLMAAGAGVGFICAVFLLAGEMLLTSIKGWADEAKTRRLEAEFRKNDRENRERVSRFEKWVV